MQTSHWRAGDGRGREEERERGGGREEFISLCILNGNNAGAKMQNMLLKAAMPIFTERTQALTRPQNIHEKREQTLTQQRGRNLFESRELEHHGESKD